MSPPAVSVPRSPRAVRLGAAVLAVLLGGLADPARAEDDEAPLPPASAAGREVEVIREIGAYYTSLAVQIPLVDTPAEDGATMSESEVYRRLFAASARPSVLLLEASIYPMPLLGTWLKRHSPGFYDTRIGGVDLVPAVTAGFQEPWAIAAFVGSDMRFTKPGEAQRDTNRGYMGYLLAAGDRHIKDNRLIDDDWLEFEWKMKGERVFVGDRLLWSFRVGARWHGNPDVADTVYLGIGRSDTNYGLPILAWLNNTRVALTTEFDQDGLGFLRQEVIVGKKFPLGRRFPAVQIDAGLIVEKRSKYRGALAEEGAGGTTFVLRPNVEF